MEKYKLTRSGKPPLAFEGEILAEVGGKWQSGRELNRWYDIKIYRTVGGRHILRIEYNTVWQGEEGHDYVDDFADAKELADAATAYDPTEHTAGFPPGTQYEEKQQRLMTGLRTQYEARLSEALQEVPGAEETIL